MARIEDGTRIYAVMTLCDTKQQESKYYTESN